MNISIVTPSYNQGKLISKTIDSILMQNIGSRLEYIIVDSLSDDDTDKIIRSRIPDIKKNGITFKYIREKDSGQADAINKGWKVSNGDIVAWINSDDEYYPNVLKNVLDFFEHNPNIKWAYGGWSYTDKNGKIYKTIEPKKFNKNTLFSYDNIGQPACFVKKSMLKKAGYLNQDLHYTMDYDLWLRLAKDSDPGIIDKKIAKLRCYTDTKSSRHAVEQFFSVYKLNSKHSKVFSWLRVMQILYAIIGILLGVLHLDIANRINKNIKIPLFDS